MAIEIVDLPTKDGDCPVRYVKLPEGTILGDRSRYGKKFFEGTWLTFTVIGL